AHAAAIASNTHTSAVADVVAVSIFVRPVEPPVTLSRFEATIYMMFKNANVPSDATRPDNRISGAAITSPVRAAATPPIIVAEILPTVTLGSAGNRMVLVS